MENIDIAATAELLLGIAILYFIAKSLIKSRSEKNVIGHIETAAPYKVETPVAPVVEVDQTAVVAASEASAIATTKPARKTATKKPATKKAPAKKTAKKKSAAE